MTHVGICSKNVSVGYGSIVGVATGGKARNRLDLEVSLLYSQSMGAPHATLPQGNQCVLVKWQKTGVRRKPEPDPLLGFL